ncbi:MAG TPA: ferredoxin [Coprothermobacter proteolyticus]|jgi:ferredoxin|uniref:Ferredoxin n=1 Tax=Coprothermobacter proteolyticus (strain ATCC 35245 / DSM 5265 / OCM 4 / BT) TaxID=309798 RepID=B5Y8K6_COPPD|nr:ferredoxin [Coprothermobacter proteolyticus]MBK6585638.1 ferredoxin [Coprothermobacter sp.]ACI18126.1 ferredoxin [Coprothermobacter proteolyticus DSM 5265]MBP8983198.1 ferredoxin [Coprothermobacter sp.]HOA64394.1 ferredoxin [Coprothermobacter proteolyticus]HOK24189.1 ferredoxin [Coprothermobacter proteolyticus]
MALKVDKELCIACGVCMALCPEVFQADAEGKSEVIEGADETLPCVDEAIDSCPTGAISRE